jgi:hypothetical protein
MAAMGEGGGWGAHVLCLVWFALFLLPTSCFRGLRYKCLHIYISKQRQIHLILLGLKGWVRIWGTSEKKKKEAPNRQQRLHVRSLACEST